MSPPAYAPLITVRHSGTSVVHLFCGWSARSAMNVSDKEQSSLWASIDVAPDVALLDHDVPEGTSWSWPPTTCALPPASPTTSSSMAARWWKAAHRSWREGDQRCWRPCLGVEPGSAANEAAALTLSYEGHGEFYRAASAAVQAALQINVTYSWADLSCHFLVGSAPSAVFGH